MANSEYRANLNNYGRRVQVVDQEEEDNDDNYTVLNIEGEENSKLYFMECFINGNRFKTMTDSGSLVTIFALDELKRINKERELAREKHDER